MGRHSASDAHLIGTPGGVVQVRTVRRLTREQRNDDVRKRAFDNFIGSLGNLSGSKPSLQEQIAHGEKSTLTPGCKGCTWARRGYHHTKAYKARKREFLLTKARSEELRAAEADAWRKLASATEPSNSAIPSGSAREEGAQREPVDEQPQPQPDWGDPEMAVSTETPDAEMIRRTRIVAKRSDPAVPTEGPRGCESGASTRVRRVEKRARIPAPASVNPETFAMMPESDGNLETYTELNSAGFA